VGETLFKSFPVTEIGESGGDVTVLGKCSDGELDSDGDIVSPAFMAQAIKTWMRVCPSVYREHSPGYPAGRGLDAWQDDTGATWVKSLIADDEAKDLVRSGRLKAYSVGIRDPETRKSARVRRWEIVGGRLTEVSIVSAPANARCGVKIIGKSVSGVPEFIGKAWEMDKTEKQLRKAARVLGIPAVEVDAVLIEKAAAGAMRMQMRTALESSNPLWREMAREVLGVQD